MDTTTDAAVTTVTTVDARGKACPGPLVSLAKALKGAAPGARFELVATDPGSRTDVPAWAELTGHELLESTELGGEYRYLIRTR